MIPYFFNLFIDLICFPDGFDNKLNIFIYALECVESSVTGMLLGILLKKGRNAAMCAFFMLLFVMMFSMIAFDSVEFKYAVSVLLPAYSTSFNEKK